MAFIASELLAASATKHGIRLELLVAETGLWANPEVHRRLALDANGPAYFPTRRRYRAGQGETRGQRIGDVVLDDNSYANLAIKYAVGVPRSELVGFEACHIWPKTCYDERCHTVIANLVLLPRALAGLTDHMPAVQAALQFRAWQLYGWHPTDKSQPTEPSGYPAEWREPMLFNARAAAALAKRTAKGRSIEGPAGDPAQAPQKDFTRYDIAIPSGDVMRNLPKRLAMLTLVRGLVESGVIPELIANTLPTLRGRLFRSAPGSLDAKAFVETMTAQRLHEGKTFDPSRYFCSDGELLQVRGRTYALTNQWGGWTASSMAALLAAFPDAGVVVTARP